LGKDGGGIRCFLYQTVCIEFGKQKRNYIQKSQREKSIGETLKSKWTSEKYIESKRQHKQFAVPVPTLG
jgi:hypothetical protein